MSDSCPHPLPCPLPMITGDGNCQFIPPITDSCGCNSGCGTIDCSSVPTV